MGEGQCHTVCRSGRGSFPTTRTVSFSPVTFLSELCWNDGRDWGRMQVKSSCIIQSRSKRPCCTVGRLCPGIAECPWTSPSPSLGVSFFLYQMRGPFNVLSRVKILLFCHSHVHAGWAEQLLAFISLWDGMDLLLPEALPKHASEIHPSPLKLGCMYHLSHILFILIT